MVLSNHLPEHVRTYIRKQVETGAFPTEEAVITNAVEQQMDKYRWEEDEDLLEAIAEADRGDIVTMDDPATYLDRLSGEARELVKHGHEVSDDVKY